MITPLITPNTRVVALRRQGWVDLVFGVALALALAAGSGEAGVVLLVGATAILLALRGARRQQLAVPLAAPQQRELKRLRLESRQVDRFLDSLERMGQEPALFDLHHCRHLAVLESLLSRGLGA